MAPPLKMMYCISYRYIIPLCTSPVKVYLQTNFSIWHFIIFVHCCNIQSSQNKTDVVHIETSPQKLHLHFIRHFFRCFLLPCSEKTHVEVPLMKVPKPFRQEQYQEKHSTYSATHSGIFQHSHYKRNEVL